MDNTLKIFAGRSNPELVKQIAQEVDHQLGKISFRNFSDGEIWLKFENNIRGDDVFIVQSTNPPADNLVELLLMIDAAKRASAKRITAVLPYFGYARQDRKDQPRVPISSRLFIDTIVSAGAQRIMAMDLHSTQIQGYVNIPFDHLYAKPLFINRITKLMADKEFAIVSPDIGGVKFARSWAKKMCVPFAIIDKRRPEPNKAKIMNVIGETNSKNYLILDDMIDTGGTVIEAAKLLKNVGAHTVTVAATHGLFSGECIPRFKDPAIDKVIVTDSLHIPQEKRIEKLEIISAAPLLAEAIIRIHKEESISTLFDI